MKKRIGLGCALALCALITLSALPVKTVPPLIRLHVLAVSDSEEDQARKLIVRDAVLETAQQMLSESTDYAQAYSILDERLADIEAAAERALTGETISATLTKEHYPDRDYGTFTLPEGEYTSLKVVIGEGQGQNWWCVVYPSLCVPGSEQAASIPALAQPKPLRSVVWQWLRTLWQDSAMRAEV